MQLQWSIEFSYRDIQLLSAILQEICMAVSGSQCGLRQWFNSWGAHGYHLGETRAFGDIAGFYKVVKYNVSSSNCRWAIKTLMWNRCLVFFTFYDTIMLAWETEKEPFSVPSTSIELKFFLQFKTMLVTSFYLEKEDWAQEFNSQIIEDLPK